MNIQEDTYPPLTKPVKGLYPFNIGTTSFIYPANYIPNVSRLGGFFDEIELLVFESKDFEILFPKTVVKELSKLAADLNLSYNIHLPTDISISDPDPVKQQQAIETLVNVIGRMAPLCPTSHTLHVPYIEGTYEANKVKHWQDTVRRNLLKIRDAGIASELISIESLDYPLEMIADIVADLDLRLCLDIGHLLMQRHDGPEIIERYADLTSIIHLHGVEDDHDHVALDCLPINVMIGILQAISEFTGTVSLEVFSFEHLQRSIEYFDRCWWKMRDMADG